MTQLIPGLLPILLVLLAIGMILGLPVGKWAKQLGMRWLVIAALILFGPAVFYGLWDYARHNPPQSLREVLTWLGVGFLAVALLLRLIFGAGFAGRMFEHLIFSAVYDFLKAVVGLMFKLIKIIFRLPFGFRSRDLPRGAAPDVAAATPAQTITGGADGSPVQEDKEK
jgi:hypothetical protein